MTANAAYERGRSLFAVRSFQEALGQFDLAIANGFEEEMKFQDGEIYIWRAGCLQMLNFHLDAIDDFDRGILISPGNGERHFQRSVSKGAVGDFAGAVADLEEAVRLDSANNHENQLMLESRLELARTINSGKYVEEDKERKRSRAKRRSGNV